MTFTCETCQHYEPPRFPLDDHWCMTCALPVYEAIRPGQCGPKRNLYAKKGEAVDQG